MVAVLPLEFCTSDGAVTTLAVDFLQGCFASFLGGGDASLWRSAIFSFEEICVGFNESDDGSVALFKDGPVRALTNFLVSSCIFKCFLGPTLAYFYKFLKYGTGLN